VPTSGEITRGAGLRVLDLAALVLAFPVAVAIYEQLWFARARSLQTDAYWPALVVALVLWTASAWVHQLYEHPVGRTTTADVLRTLRVLATVALALTALAFAMKQEGMSRLAAGVYFAVSAALLVGVRLAGRALARATGRGKNAKRFAIVGTGGMAREIAEIAAANPHWGLSFAGFIPVDGTPLRSRGPLLGELSRLGRILEEHVLDTVVFAVPRDRLSEVQRGIQLCEEQGVDVQISLDVLRFGPGRMTVADFDGVPMLGFTRTPSDRLALAAKRVFDVVASALALLVFAPVLAGIAIAIRLDSPGPALFRQRRVGRNGREFWMLKFRSMHADAERRLEALRAQNEMSGPVFKMTHDPRVTRVGGFLRRTSLDEFPQFLNVLMGDMSIVGPRPPVPSEVREYRRWQRRRLSVKPGITCLWQISGRNDVDFDRWMELDLEYIDTWSLLGDLAICVKTVPAVLGARGAH
jgi:exopolysaccharide biosynthesis polyprenyl glycosylphosphotransferase